MQKGIKMIKRWYFISGTKCNYDGSGVSHPAHAQFAIKSWSQDKDLVFKRGSKIIKKILANKPGDHVVITSFNKC